MDAGINTVNNVEGAAERTDGPATTLCSFAPKKNENLMEKDSGRLPYGTAPSTKTTHDTGIRNTSSLSSSPTTLCFLKSDMTAEQAVDSSDNGGEANKADRDCLLKTLATSGEPQANREDTVEVMKRLIHEPRPPACNVYGRGPMLVSDVPASARSKGVIMGIDEAGRGPVLGPMTYGAAYWAPCDNASVPAGYLDSKALTPEVRSNLFEKTLEALEVGFVLRVLHASEISRNMLRREPYNLNAMSHDAAMQMIQAVIDAGVKIDTCYVDTVGTASSYQAQLERVFSGKGIRFVVEKKADAKYAQCSAASVGT